jgi:hypothetical protein
MPHRETSEVLLKLIFRFKFHEFFPEVIYIIFLFARRVIFQLLVKYKNRLPTLVFLYFLIFYYVLIDC